MTQWALVVLNDILQPRTEIYAPTSLLDKSIRMISKIRFSDGEMEFRTDCASKTTLISIQHGDIVISGINALKGAVALNTKNDSRPLFATIHYSAYGIKLERADPRFLWYLLRSRKFMDSVEKQVPNGIKTELKPKRLLNIEILLPDIAEQRLIVSRLDHAARLILDADDLNRKAVEAQEEFLFSLISEIAKEAPRLPLKEVAPIIRRKVEIEKDTEYSELGIRSFGKGTFHKPAIIGAELGSKRIYRIEPGDLMFSNVFAWEGAIAIAQPADKNRFGSHRFITCLPDTSKALPEYLRTWFLSSEGMAEIRAASPGAAGRNKTLNLKKLEAIQVPIPDITKQRRFSDVYARVQAARKLNTQTAAELDTLMPAVLDKAFKGEL